MKTEIKITKRSIINIKLIPKVVIAVFVIAVDILPQNGFVYSEATRIILEERGLIRDIYIGYLALCKYMTSKPITCYIRDQNNRMKAEKGFYLLTVFKWKSNFELYRVRSVWNIENNMLH